LAKIKVKGSTTEDTSDVPQPEKEQVQDSHQKSGVKHEAEDAKKAAIAFALEPHI
jgi:hypothetical protein